MRRNCCCGGVLGLWLPIHNQCAFRWLYSIKSKVYLSPKLWYLRLSIIEAQELVAGDKGSLTSMVRFLEFFAKAQIGDQVLRTRISMTATNRSLCNPFWNESLMFVIAELFEDYLLISVEDRVAPNREERRLDDKQVVSRWFNLDGDSKNVARFGFRIHIRASLEQYTWEVFDPFTVVTIGVLIAFHLLSSMVSTVRLKIISP
ncbi:C2 domain [Dillenia turbinata]|uniref:C2 domain n=1 Tax=Dillenia turbinata TaxID=194707 RepID=A0AAN8VVN4_9MAGN